MAERATSDSRQCYAAKLEVSQAFGDRQGRASGGFVFVADGQRGERVPLGEGAFLGELQGLLDPAIDEGEVRLLDPHPGPLHRLQGEVGVHLGRRAGDVQRLLHGLPETLSVVLEGAGQADPLPDRGLLSRAAFEAQGPMEQGQALVDLVAADSQLRGPPRPPDCLAAQALGLLFPAGPGQVEVFRADGLGVMVRQQRRVLVLASPVPLEPLREAGVQRSPLRPEEARVGDLAGERVLDHVLPLARDRGAGVTVHEVPFLKQAEVRVRLRHEVTDGTAPKDPPDHGGRLQRRLLGPGSKSMRAASTAWTVSGTEKPGGS